MEPLYCGHLGDLVKCPVYSGTPLLWTPWGPGEVSCVQWNPSIVDTLGTWWSVLYTVEPLYCGHLGDLVKCPVYSGTSLLWTPWGPGEVSCIQWNPSIVDTSSSPPPPPPPPPPKKKNKTKKIPGWNPVNNKAHLKRPSVEDKFQR